LIWELPLAPCLLCLSVRNCFIKLASWPLDELGLCCF
jgi:hypothetical protein